MVTKRANNEVLLKQIHAGDEDAKAIFVNQNTALVHAIAKRFNNQRVSQEDLFQIGCIGLMKAINQFDFSYKVKFSTYAVPIIMGEIKRFFRDDGSMHISRSLKEGYIKMIKVKDAISQELHREPTYQEIADALQVEVGEVILAFEANQFIYSLDETIYENDGSSIQLQDKVKDNHQEDIVMKLALQEEVLHLKPREQLILHYRYDLSMKQDEIAEKIGISQVQVSRIEKKIIQKLKQRLIQTG